jgi:hypothetical protein
VSAGDASMFPEEWGDQSKEGMKEVKDVKRNRT